MAPAESKYGKIAVAAAKKAAKGDDALSAWKESAHAILADSPEAAVKSCPKTAFLGLVRAGKLLGIPADASKAPESKNGWYALTALELLRQCSPHGSNPNALWREVMKGVKKQHNSQMHVVLALWNEKLFVDQIT